MSFQNSSCPVPCRCCRFQFLVAGGILLVGGQFASAQEALRNAVLNDRGLAERREYRASPPADEPGWKAGPVRFAVGFSYGLEFNDNVRNSETDPEGDLIQAPALNVGIAGPISERSDLNFQMGVGYQAYWHNAELSQWIISPGSEVAYDLQVTDVFITLFDRFSFTQDVYSEPGLANQAQVPRFENTLGTQISWIPDRFVVAGGYSYQISFSDSQEFEYLNRNSHLLFGRAGYLFGDGAASSGLEVSATLTDYEQNLNSDTTVISLGPYLDWQLTEAIEIRLRGGYVMYSYETVLAPGQAKDQSDFYLGMNLDQELTGYIRHGLAITQGVRAGAEQATAFVLETAIGYSISWAFIDSASLNLGLNYIRGEQSASEPLTLSEVYDQYRLGIGAQWNPIGRLSLNAGYDVYVRESDVATRSYTVNRVLFGAGYTF